MRPPPVSGFTLIAEDGNPLPDLAAPRVKTEVFMAAGKTYDVMVNVPAIPTGTTTPPSLPIYDRELSLSANSSVRDAGMLAYIGVNGAALPVAGGDGCIRSRARQPGYLRRRHPMLDRGHRAFPWSSPTHPRA